MADLAGIAEPAAELQLAVIGAFHTKAEDDLPEGGTLALLGPAGSGFWPHVTGEPEFADGAPDPMDRWSRRVIDELAEKVRGTALFPFGTPLRPFIRWALRSGRAWPSPVGLLVHDEAGLLVSYRGALFVAERLELPETRARPCEACEARPCLTACPVSAMTGDGYDLKACHTYLDTENGFLCMTEGCAVRISCPVSQGYGRSAAQSAYHMRQFHK